MPGFGDYFLGMYSAAEGNSEPLEVIRIVADRGLKAQQGEKTEVLEANGEKEKMVRLTGSLLCLLPKLPQRFSNFPEGYVKKQTAFIEWETPRLPNYQRKVVRWRKQAYYDIHRPWSREFRDQNAPHTFQPNIYVEPIKRFNVFRGDRVEVLKGRDQGKQGIVNMVIKERNWVTVDGLNTKRTIRQKTSDFPGLCFTEEMPLLVPREVCLVDPADKKPTRVEWRYDEDGNQVRISMRSGRIIPIPTEAYETIDYKSRSLYVEQPKDTPAKEVKKITFKPKVRTFEMDIMEEMGVKEERVPYAMYWY